MKVYMIMFDWSTENSCDVIVEIYSTYENALKRYEEIIKDEKTPDFSWAAEAFDEHGNVESDYEFFENIKPALNDESERRWFLARKDDWFTHDIIDLKVMEVK